MSEVLKSGITQFANEWRLSGDILMDNANQILNQSAAFNLAGEIKVDFANIKTVDTAALSLILEWQRRAAAASCKLSFVNLPANLMSLANVYGVAAFIPVSH